MRRESAKRAGRFLLWGLALVLIGNLVRLVYTNVTPVEVRAASAKPFTVTRTERGFDKQGQLRYTNHYVEAVRSDGARVFRNTTPLADQRRIDLTNGDEILINERLGRKSTYPGRYSGVKTERNPAANCFTSADAQSGWVIAGSEEIGGYRAVRLAFNGSGRNWTAWHALDLGCAVLKMRYEDENAVTTQDLDSVVQSDPDPALFDVSSAYAEMPPSSLFERLPEPQKQRLDANYNALRAAAARNSSPGR